MDTTVFFFSSPASCEPVRRLEIQLRAIMVTFQDDGLHLDCAVVVRGVATMETAPVHCPTAAMLILSH